MRSPTKHKQGILLEPSDPNPYEAPKEAAKVASQSFIRPNIFDWFFAIVLGVLAFAIAIPMTCFGNIIAVNLTKETFGAGSSIASLLYWIASWAAFIFLFGSPFLAGYLYIRAVKKWRAKRAAKKGEAKA